jgi:hypothetical protein
MGMEWINGDKGGQAGRGTCEGKGGVTARRDRGLGSKQSEELV